MEMYFGSVARVTLLGVVPVLLLSACRHEPARSYDSAAAVTVPMSLAGTHASIEVQVNGRPARMLLDTGADQIAVSPVAAERLGLATETGLTPGSGAAGSIAALKTSIDDLAVREFYLRRQVAYVVPFPQEFQYDGVLGIPFFAAFVTTMDYQRGLFTFEATHAFETRRDATSIPIRVENGKLLVSATAGGVSGWYSIDTGAGNALTFFTPTVERLHLRDAFTPSVTMVTGLSVGGYTHGTLVRLPRVDIGPFSFEQVVAELSLDAVGYFAASQNTGNLGGELWQRFTVTLDYANGCMYLTPNDAFNVPFAGPRSGLVPAVVDEVVKVIYVLEGGPAAEAGVHAGDTIVALNSVVLAPTIDAAQATNTVVQALKAEAGTPIVLRLRDASGAEREVGFVLRELI